ncbi:MAG TPA: type II secretion system protein GspM [Rhizomicrobium sp.]
MTAVPQFLLGRRAAITGLCVVMVLFGIFVVTPILAIYTSQQQEMTDSLHQLALFRAEAAMRPQLETQLRTLRQHGPETPGLIGATSTALAQAQLERDVKAIVETNGGEVHSAQIGETSTIGNLGIVTVQCDLSVPMAHLSALLYAIESHTPYLFVDRADIVAPAGWQAAGTALSNPMLELHWTIRGYRWDAK